MSGAGVPIPFHNQVQGWRRLNIEGECVADPFPVRKAARIDVKRRSDDLEVINVRPIGTAIAESPVNADRTCHTSHEEIDPVDGILIAVGITEPPLGPIGLDVNKWFQRQPGETDRTQA